MSKLRDELTHMTPMSTNLAGGKQSHIKRDFTLIPPDALAQVARVLHDGAQKYDKDNWKLIPCDDHINHALNHIYLYLAGNMEEDHLPHAATRLLMALELEDTRTPLDN